MDKRLDTRPVFTSRRKEQEWVRMQAVKMYRQGESAAKIGALLEVTPRAVLQWASNFFKDGQDGLVARQVPGRPPKLNREQLQRLAFLVQAHAPNQLGFDFGLWTLRLIAQLIEREFKVKLSLPTVGKVMHDLGFSPQRPLHRAWEQDSALVAQWKSQELPAILERAKRTGASVLFADEAGVRSDYHSGTTWGLTGKTPVVRTTGTRTSVQMISAIGVEGSMQFMTHEGLVNADVFLKFLQQLMLETTQPIILIVDGHSIHKAKSVKSYVESTEGRLEIVYLPPYSPQLNPDEQVWKHVKADIAKHPIANKFDFRLAVEKALVRLKSMTKIVAAFFRHPECGFI